MPRMPVRDGRGAVGPRTPLGELWTGHCHAPGQQTAEIGEALCNPCNSGYAARVCSRFPAEGPSDAVRFHVAVDNDEALRLQYVYERQWWPAGHGVLEYSVARGEVTPATADAILRGQAAAFAQSWIFRTRRDA